MPRTVSIGTQDFEKIIANNCFYVDKTAFIKEWWESMDSVTLITRPRRFGKTLNMNMLECFWSIQRNVPEEVFYGLDIWEEEKYRELQGTYPVLFLTFADVKQTTLRDAVRKIKKNITELYNRNDFLLKSHLLNDAEREQFQSVRPTMDDAAAQDAIQDLMKYLERYYGKKVIMLLDEYDTPMQEAYVGGYWEELVSFTRGLFNATFKTNPYLERAIMTGITRVSRESMFSDLNNLKVVTTTSKQYETAFGFTETEVFDAMDEFGMEEKDEVKRWYDGFTFGDTTDIYNPWSIINMLDDREFKTYWANTSSNSLAGNLIRTGSKNIKMQFEQLLLGGSILCCLDEEVVYSQLEQNEGAMWSLLLATGYLKIVGMQGKQYELTLTNYEVSQMFERMVQNWFAVDESDYNDFIKALLLGDVKAMNEYMNRVSLSVFSSFDVGKKPSQAKQPERFYHGFVLGLLVELAGRYRVTSNRESGFGRYDVLLEPLDVREDGIILEFKVHDPEDEADLKATVEAALAQIEEKKYEQTLLDLGIEKAHIRKYGFAFEGNRVLIGA
ncbi:MAG: ATP-binding protein [Clostridium sp.]|nr:ATP-binding protein [Clostridium sp.]